MEKPDLKLSILMPVRDEGVNIGIMLKILKAVIDIPHEVLIIYDFPEDNSVPVVRRMQSGYSGARLVHNKIGPGVANAIKAGIDTARGGYILLFAVDEVGPVLAIEDMLALMDGGCEIVSCTRYAYGGKRLGGSLIGGMLSRAGNRLFGIFSGATFTDGTTGIKMFRKEHFDRLCVGSRPVGWTIVFEMAIRAQAAGMKMGEIPIVSIDRLYGGKSTFSLGPWFREYLKCFFWGIRELRKSGKPQKTKVKIPQNLA